MNIKKEFEEEFNFTPESVIEPYWTWIETKIKEAKEEGFNAGCDYTTEQYEKTLAEVSKVYCERKRD